MATDNNAARGQHPAREDRHTVSTSDSRWMTYAMLCERINRSWKTHASRLETEIATHLYNISDLRMHNAGLSAVVTSMMRAQGLMESHPDAATAIEAIKAHPDYQSGVQRYCHQMTGRHASQPPDPLPCPHHQRRE
ncbi:hypothetical protein KUA08_14970 [Komagataeibacter melomenusus]|nr:hypothetical protein [Komagataeibacter melomenusus]MBV1831892.1 hypothetical protein [Komagataeibacter melomenusus]